MAVRTAVDAFNTRDGATGPVHLAYPDDVGPVPAIMIGYELWGMEEIPEGAVPMRDAAARLADAGYVAAIPDYYAARGARPRIEDGKVVGSLPDPVAIADLIAAANWIGTLDDVDAHRIGMVGWCSGGRLALFLAARCGVLKAVAVFYGRPVNLPHMLGPSPIDTASQIPCPVFAGFGEADAGIPIETVHALDRALVEARAPHELHIYPRAGHAFMNDGGSSYQPAAAELAWRQLIAFFDANLTAAHRPARMDEGES